MKKLIVGLLTALLMSAGLVATTSTTATAACPYTECGNVKVNAKGAAAKRANVAKILVRVVQGRRVARRAKGTITITLVNNAGKTKSKTIAFKGTRKRFAVNIPRLRKGNWAYTVTFTPNANNFFKGDSTSGTTFVKGKRARG
ncbi:hypothetical protein [Nocardioides bruguierae]|uniref:Uncharacterized protein n=1 Tax=Nocardioides bruguierae TaxID=2945102 RepID=A0A9X2D9X6_9ACTN|nr:hypothetical protein [Nocardioides bruguierae]MCM0621856.1 hypothetical protein [Nocardioides bruguierae]